ncbi:MAG: type II secretion system protein GspM [Sedimenticola sp.]
MNPRERLFLALGTAVSLLLLLYLVVYVPVEQSIEKAESRLKGSQEQLARLQAISDEYRRLSHLDSRAVGRGAESLLSIIEKSSQQYGLNSAIRRITPEGEQKVRIQLQEVSFDKLTAWFSQLAISEGISTETIIVRGGDTAGLVNVNLMLKRS